VNPTDPNVINYAIDVHQSFSRRNEFFASGAISPLKGRCFSNAIPGIEMALLSKMEIPSDWIPKSLFTGEVSPGRVNDVK
jgi:hypothetical protein